MVKEKTAGEAVHEAPTPPKAGGSLPEATNAKLLDIAKGGTGGRIAAAPELRSVEVAPLSPKFFSDAHRIDAAKARKGDRLSEIPHLDSQSGHRPKE